MRKSIILLIAISFIVSSDAFKLRKNKYYEYLIKKCNDYSYKKMNNDSTYVKMKNNNTLSNTTAFSNYEFYLANKYKKECYENVNKTNGGLDVMLCLIIWIVFTIFI